MMLDAFGAIQSLPNRLRSRTTKQDRHSRLSRNHDAIGIGLRFPHSSEKSLAARDGYCLSSEQTTNCSWERLPLCLSPPETNLMHLLRQYTKPFQNIWIC